MAIAPLSRLRPLGRVGISKEDRAPQRVTKGPKPRAALSAASTPSQRRADRSRPLRHRLKSDQGRSAKAAQLVPLAASTGIAAHRSSRESVPLEKHTTTATGGRESQITESPNAGWHNSLI